MPFQTTGFKTGRLVGQSTGASFTTDWFNAGADSKISIHVNLTNADSVGSIAIQATNDTSTTGALNAVAVPFDDGTGTIVTSFTVSSGTDVDKIFRVDAYEGFYRIVYTRTSGGAADTFDAVALKKRG